MVPSEGTSIAGTASGSLGVLFIDGSGTFEGTSVSGTATGSPGAWSFTGSGVFVWSGRSQLVWFSDSTTSAWGSGGVFVKSEVVIGDLIEFVVVVKVDVKTWGPKGSIVRLVTSVWGGTFSDPMLGSLRRFSLSSRLACHRGCLFIGRSVMFTIVSWVEVGVLVGIMVGFMGSW